MLRLLGFLPLGLAAWWEVSSEENAKSLALYFDREALKKKLKVNLKFS